MINIGAMNSFKVFILFFALWLIEPSFLAGADTTQIVPHITNCSSHKSGGMCPGVNNNRRISSFLATLFFPTQH